MNKQLVIATIAFIVWFSWFFRYEVSDSGVVILDRLTGDLYYAVGQMKRSLHDTPDAEP